MTLNSTPHAPPSRLVDLHELFLEVLSILSRAGQAAHYYETRRTASRQWLAEQGLEPGDLPRAAYEILTDGEVRAKKSARPRPQRG
jgi:hypothetical protein